MALHGGLVSGVSFSPQAGVAERRRVRLIAVDRPGYGDSSWHPELSYRSLAADVGSLADHLGLDRFALLGQSSGGPYAAGCARFLNDRVVGCAIVSGAAPPEAGVSNRRQLRTFRIARRVALIAPPLSSAVYQAALRQGQRRPDKVIARMCRTLPDCDRVVVERPDIRGGVRDEIARPKSRTAGRAATLDLRLQLRPWGFDLRDIGSPVDVWHGALDLSVVVEEGRYLARRIPGATMHEKANSGHWLLHSHFAEILDALTADRKFT